MARCKRTLKKMSIIIRELIGKKTPARAVLEFKQTFRVGRHRRKREREEEEMERDKKWR